MMNAEDRRVATAKRGWPLAARILANIEVRGPDECWPWKLRGRKPRYPEVNIRNPRKGVKRKSTLAHRAMWQLFIGPIPEGLCVCHECDDGYCLNPRHHFLGTHTDNMRDMVAKGRQVSTGHRRGTGRLSEAAVRDIRARMTAPGRARTVAGRLAGRYGIGHKMVRLVAQRKRYTWVV